MSMCVLSPVFYPLLYRMTFCTLLAGRRVRVVHSLSSLFSTLLPPLSFHCFSISFSIWPSFSSRANYLVEWWQHPSSAHWDENQEWDPLCQWCDGRWCQETVSNLPHNTQGTFATFSNSFPDLSEMPKRPVTHTNRQSSFFLRTIVLWNSLPPSC